VTVALWYWLPEFYGVWYYVLQGAIAVVVGVLGIVAGLRYSKPLTIIFGVLLVIRYIYYIVVEVMLSQKGSNVQFQKLVWWFAIPLAAIKIVYAVRKRWHVQKKESSVVFIFLSFFLSVLQALIFYFLILFYRELTHAPKAFLENTSNVELVLVDEEQGENLLQQSTQQQQQQEEAGEEQVRFFFF
jgi:hypothetical protein